jgi:acyl carrier protein
MNEERFLAVMAPKATGAWNLHSRTMSLPVDFFVMFSSVASVIGNPGQGNYVAANAYLDALAHHRRSLGLPAMTVNWGHLGQMGYVSRNSHVSDYLNRHGIAELSPQEAHELFGVLIRSDCTQASAMRIDWPHWAEANPRLKKAPKFRDMVSLDVGGDSQKSLISMILDSQGEQRQRQVEDFVRETASRVLGIPTSQLEPTRALSEFGLDSLMGIELVNRLEEGLKSKLPVEKIGKNPTIQTISALLAESLPERPGDECKT